MTQQLRPAVIAAELLLQQELLADKRRHETVGALITRLTRRIKHWRTS